MIIVVDENIPSVHEYFSVFGEVRALPGRHLSAEQVVDADVLVLRSVTQVDESLLRDSKVGFVGTCTIGTDHLDTAYLDQQGIGYASAPGCNAGGVLQYDIAALTHCRPQWASSTIGIIGCGNVGGRIRKALLALGVSIKVYDPYKSANDIPELCPLNELLSSSDIVCMHTPHTKKGDFPTHHMIAHEQLALLKKGCLLLNAGRGGAIDNQALLAFMQAKPGVDVVLDVWESEPKILLPLLEHVMIATSHIAGYSHEGKVNGTVMVFEALLEHLRTQDMDVDITLLRQHCDQLTSKLYGDSESLNVTTVAEAVASSYDIEADSQRFKATMQAAATDDHGRLFDDLRKNYPMRREFSHYKLLESDAHVQDVAGKLGFGGSRASADRSVEKNGTGNG